MPTGSRIRGNNVFGFITDNPLTAGDGTFNSPGLATLPVVAVPDHAVITLDPMREFGEPEIVVVTSHTASATVASITRGQYGTVARSHPQTTLFVHAPIDEDVIEILTSITRPSNPYEGQFIFESDTNKLVGFGGTDWAPRDAGGTLGYAQVTASQAGIGAETDLTGLSVAVTVGTGRRIRISTHGRIDKDATPGEVIGRIREGATELVRWANWFGMPASQAINQDGSVVLTPTAGAHTYKLTLSASAGTASLFAIATSPAYILVEDIGAV